MTEFTKYVLSDIPNSDRVILNGELFVTMMATNGEKSSVYITDKRFTSPRKLVKENSYYFIINEPPIYDTEKDIQHMDKR